MLSVLVVDSNTFTRGLISEILRSQDVVNIHGAPDELTAQRALRDKPIDLIFVSWEETDALDGLQFVRSLRRKNDDRVRRLPVVLVTSGLTRQLVISGRDAGVDEFLAKPITPAAMGQRLEMVIETPRPFVDHPVYLGPCRRRKNPADYHGAKRRTGDRADEQPSQMVDADEEAAKAPIRIALAKLRETFDGLRAGSGGAMNAAIAQIKLSRTIATDSNDHALQNALTSFETYINVTCPAGRTDGKVLATALSALEQLAALPPNYKDARESVSGALSKAIHRKLAA